MAASDHQVRAWGVSQHRAAIRQGLKMKLLPFKRLAFATSALAPLIFWSPATAAVLPSGGTVVAGKASIGAPSGSSLTVSQSSGKAIINWNGFSIGAGGKVQFDNGRGATLNRVTGAQLSSLDGLLSATGSVYLINPNGVIVGKSGVVNVGGTFVASTLDTSNAGFLKGGPLSFSGASSAAVVNYGRIGALGGDVALIAARVDNAGAIAAANGDAGLLASYRVVLRDTGLDDGRFSVQLGGAGTSVANSGLIQAADAELRAEGGNVYALAGDTAGVIRATGVKSGGGHVWLVADGGALDVAGTIEAQGAGGAAGSVETSGGQVALGSARIDAHGGTWLVDPDDLTIDATAATTIDNSLNAGTSVTEQTTATGAGGAGTVNAAGNGDIVLAAPLSWTTAAGLTLSAYRNVTLNAGETVASTGGGAVTLTADNTGTGVGTVNFGAGAGVSTAGAVTIFYNPVSYTDTATRSTQSYGGGGPGSNNFVNPYTAVVTGGGALRAYMLVNSLAQLQGVSAELDGVYALTHDLDASSSATMNPIAGGGFAGWQPIGSSNNNGVAFTGAFDGQGHVIDGLYINRTTNENGVFGTVGDAATITNLSLTNASIIGTGSDNGILAGYISGASTLANIVTAGTVSGGRVSGGLAGQDFGANTNVQSSATVSGADTIGGLIGLAGGSYTNADATGAVTGAGGTVGGLAGYFSSGALTNGYATGAVSGVGNVGGLFGQAFGNSINIAYATGAVTDTGSGDQNIGGLIGRADGGDCNCRTVYQNLYATGAVTAGANAQSVGGLFGRFHDSNLSNAYAIGAVTAPGGTRVGGLIGDNEPNSYISNSFATGAVTATGASSEVGGLIGYSFATNLSTSYASGSVTGAADVGGLVGGIINYGNDGNNSPGDGTPGVTISDTYATGSVTGVGTGAGPFYVGGLVGSDSPFDSTSPITITRSYATGAVSGAGILGGLIGGNTGTVTNDIWDRTSTGQANGVGADIPVNGASTSTVTNLTSVQDTTPGAADYAFSSAPYTAAGFSFGTTPGGVTGTAPQTWVIVDQDDSLNNANSAAGGTRPLLLSEYATNIVNAHQLQLMSLDIHTNYTLANDIDASGTSNPSDVWASSGFVPVASDIQGANQTFNATFDGQNHTINGLYINSPEEYVALFGDASYIIQNVGLVGGTIGGTDTLGFVGSIAGAFENGGTINNVYSTATVSATVGGTSNTVGVGGLVGFLQGILTNDHASGAVSGDYSVGGLVGDAFSGRISNSYATGSVADGAAKAAAGAGGLVGTNFATVSSSYATGNVGGVGISGGLIGINLGALQNVYATGSVTTSGTYAGGLVGDNAADITQASYAPTGAGVTGTTNVGGLIGAADGRGIAITGGSASGTVAGTTGVGGLIGVNRSVVVDSSASDSVSGTTAVGGLIGSNTGESVTDSYATGNVQGGTQVGGLVGASLLDTTSNPGTTYTPSITGSAPGKTYASGSVTGTVTSTGGLVGENAGTITQASYAPTGAGVSGYTVTGGLVGQNDAGATITGGSSSGAVTGAPSQSSTGGLVGLSLGQIGASFATGPVSGGDDTGGLVGIAVGGTGSGIGASYATGNVTGASVSVGGLVGSDTANITGSYATGAVSGPNQGVAGGLVGVLGFANYNGGQTGAATVQDSYATGAVSGSSYIGGLAGRVEAQSSIVGSAPGMTYASGAVTGTGTAAGGLVGENLGTITQASYGAGATNAAGAGVVGAADVGGLVGLNRAGAIVNQGSVLGKVTGTSYTGGVVGDNFATVSNVSFDGSVSGASGVGGFVGVNEGGATLTGDSVSANVTGTGNDVGGFAGASFGAVNTGLVLGTVIGVDHVGGVVGYNAAPLQGLFIGSVSGRNYVGGLVGLNYSAVGDRTVPDMGSVRVQGAQYVGGAVGWNDTAGTLDLVANTPTVIASGNYAGGLVGVNKGALTSEVVGIAEPNPGSVSGAGYVGGLVGLNQGAISYSSSLVPVTGNLYVGGLVGWNDTGATVKTSYATGAVTGIAGGQEAGTNNDYVGGLVGVNFGSVANDYATGAVSGVQVVGGLVGTNMPGGASVATSYSTGPVTASMGAVGTSFGVQAGEVTSVYGFPALSGQPLESGYTNAGSTGDATDLTPAQEDGSAAYTGFDFTNTWQSNPGGPPTLKPPTVN